MNKKYFAMVLGLLVLVFGCTTTETPGKSKAFIGGTDSLKIGFMEGSPPAEVYDAGTFPFEVTVRVENKGEYDVSKEKVKVTLLGIDPSQFNNPVMSKNPDSDLKGAYVNPDGNVIPGEQTYITFSGFNYMDTLIGNTPFTFRADACYVYGTKAQFMICVRKDLTSVSETVCKVTEAKSSESSSAPVQVTNVREEVSGTEKITFTFDIAHKGVGAISRKESDCNDKVIDKDKVYVKVTGLTGVKCSGLDGSETEGYVTLYSGTRNIRCTYDVSEATGDFEKAVNIELTYDYKEHIDTTVLVKHATG